MLSELSFHSYRSCFGFPIFMRVEFTPANAVGLGFSNKGRQIDFIWLWIGFVFLCPAKQDFVIISFQIKACADLLRRQIGFVFSNMLIPKKHIPSKVCTEQSRSVECIVNDNVSHFQFSIHHIQTIQLLNIYYTKEKYKCQVKFWIIFRFFKHISFSTKSNPRTGGLERLGFEII